MQFHPVQHNCAYVVYNWDTVDKFILVNTSYCNLGQMYYALGIYMVTLSCMSRLLGVVKR